MKCGKFYCGNSGLLCTFFPSAVAVLRLSLCSYLFGFLFSSLSVVAYFALAAAHFVAVQNCDVCCLNWLLKEMHSAQVHINNDFVS